MDALRNDADWLKGLQLNLADYEQQSFWPIGRAVIADTSDRRFATLINFDDHLTFVSMQNDGNFGVLNVNINKWQ